MVDAAERRRVIADGHRRARRRTSGCRWWTIAGLLDEVAGLVEWPVPLLGRIDDAYMDLPPEVMQVSMRVNQRYFALPQPDGRAAPCFAFVANIDADGWRRGDRRRQRARAAGAASPMRGIFWDLDRKARLESRVPMLEHVTFHAKLGTQGERVRRLERLAGEIAPLVGADAGAGRARGAAGQGRSGHRHGRRVPRTAGRDGPLLRAA